MLWPFLRFNLTWQFSNYNMFFYFFIRQKAVLRACTANQQLIKLNQRSVGPDLELHCAYRVTKIFLLQNNLAAFEVLRLISSNLISLVHYFRSLNSYLLAIQALLKGDLSPTLNFTVSFGATKILSF